VGDFGYLTINNA